MDNTIASISTSLGGAISIVRVSGKDAILMVNKIFSKDLNNVESHTINYGYIQDEAEKIDEVLISLMRAPKTYTCEDLIEINCHGGYRTTSKILELLLEKGCSLAEPGEFTKRAFLNGRIDLTKAEAVNDLINATSESARKMYMNSVSGKLYTKINNLRENIAGILANIEVNIDYPEYQDEVIVTDEMIDNYLEDINIELEKIIKDSENARIIKDGINIAIIGKPNVGKSSLLNAFLDEEKAIVTNIPGTTRDIVEGSISLNDIKINFIDTAGIRETEDVVEKIGVEKSKNQIKKADFVLMVVNNNDILTKEEEEMIESLESDKSLIFINKSDLEGKVKVGFDHVKGNTISAEGIDELKEKLVDKLRIKEILNEDMTYLGNMRQVELMKKTYVSINSAMDSKNNMMPIDIIEIDLKNAWQFLGEITGEFYEDELVDKIFSNFCLGK
ncbi:MAG: tRNA uridine-5-carboxymethylaminomethyl(34) synthesis GTPase MnmE [bacterium]